MSTCTFGCLVTHLSHSGGSDGVGGPLLSDFGDRFDFDCHTRGKRVGSRGDAGVGAGRSKNLADEIGGPVQNLSLILELCRAADQPGQPHHADNPSEIAVAGHAQLYKDVQRAQSGGLLALFKCQVAADRALE